MDQLGEEVGEGVPVGQARPAALHVAIRVQCPRRRRRPAAAAAAVVASRLLLRGCAAATAAADAAAAGAAGAGAAAALCGGAGVIASCVPRYCVRVLDPSDALIAVALRTSLNTTN